MSAAITVGMWASHYLASCVCPSALPIDIEHIETHLKRRSFCNCEYTGLCRRQDISNCVTDCIGWEISTTCVSVSQNYRECKYLWRHSTYNMLVRYILSSVRVRFNSVIPITFHAIHGRGIFSLCISLVMIVRICILYLIIITKLVVWAIRHYLELCQETTVCDVWLAKCWRWHI